MTAPTVPPAAVPGYACQFADTLPPAPGNPAAPDVSGTPGDPATRRVWLPAPASRAAPATGLALLNCLVREVSMPENQAWPAGPYLIVRLARLGVVLRSVRQQPAVDPSLRLGWPVEEWEPGTAHSGGRWVVTGWLRLSKLITEELELATGRPNPEFTGQVADSHAAMTAILRVRAAAEPPADPYLESEQALVAGHRFHPSPKSREGAPQTWLPYAPEAHTRFRLRWLAIREDLVTGTGDFTAVERLGPRPRPGFRTLPAHPWQLDRLAGRLPALHGALDRGEVIDLGPAGPEVAPTSSVRTVYAPDADLFCKFSLDVRITNCVRKNAWYELTGAVALSELLRPVFAELGALFHGCVLLAEPAFRSVTLADRRCYEGLGVIMREGVRGRTRPALTPLLAAAIADPDGGGRAAARTLVAGWEQAAERERGRVVARPRTAAREHTLAWWEAYVDRLVPPVLHAFSAYGVVLEAHLQNVLMAVDADGMPAQAIFRDLEGTKLLPGRYAGPVGELPERVRDALTYDPERAWNRVVYCLFVNHLAEVAATVAAPCPGLGYELWQLARQRVLRYARTYGADRRLRRLLAGAPLPAKANLLTRWSRASDRQAGYVQVRNPLAGER